MLKQRALNATLWSGADILVRQGVQFAVTIALARLLTPGDFGTVALLALFIGLAVTFVDGGLSAALIQRQDIEHTDESTVFWFNLGAGVVMAGALWLVAPCIAAFYDKPILVALMWVMAVNVVLGALGTIHSTLLVKRLDFRTRMKAGSIAALLSGIIAIWMAWRGWGIWALAAQTIAMTGITTALLWMLLRWRPALVFSLASLRKLFAFGGYHFASSLLDTGYARLYTLLVGRFYGVGALGYYTNAVSTQQLPEGFIASLFGRVMLPLFSGVAADKAKLRRGMQLAVRVAMLANVPMMLGMAAVAAPLVRTLFGPQWLPAVPILRVLCLAGVLLPLHLINLHVLMAQGHSRLMFRLEVTKKALGVILIVTGAFFGVMGIAWSQVIFSAVAFAINAHYSRRLLDYGVAGQARDFIGVLVVGVIMSAMVYSVSLAWHARPVIELLGLVALGIGIYAGGVWIARLAVRDEIIMLLRGLAKQTERNINQAEPS